MNLWHDITIGKNAPEEINCIVEISKGSHNKYEIDKETGLIALDRANYNSAPYPFDYAFVPQTLWEDGDALDVIILTTYPLQTGILVSVRPIAIMDMNDSGESDAKILAVPVNDKRFEDIKDLSDLNKHMLKEYAHFFETYKILKGDGSKKYPVTVSGYKDKTEATEAIIKSQKLYKEKFGK
ncbi:MAG: Inorganic pyrophosphatase [Candidatus Nomurabacteria bacterium GW2011_GWA2_40_9]|uniref:Inorganic pyrophosphatase n=1 Tax=Candidatus Nomurabacteria bacterium GW2011_GWA2_40_9 TaxID=1618734 RepID=A0A0G0TRS7_9BACT|nr:MAG: Inorganic pyrophosphatase [Candidatus Nomurabacteria bacterium GW2011_GWA2_40_9]